MSTVMPAVIGALFGTTSALVVTTYQQRASEHVARMAFEGEIEAILVSVRHPARRAALAWENGQRLADYKFYGSSSIPL